MSLQKSLEGFLCDCVRKSFEREKPLVIAVAGSVGKTSTRAAIGVALGAGEAGSRVIASPKNYNNEIGLPSTVFGCKAPGRSVFAWIELLGKAWLTRVGLRGLLAETFVLEMGTDHPGDIAYLTSVARPHVSVLTAIGAEHTEFFGTLEAVAGEEGMVLRALPDDGVAVVNADDTLVQLIVHDATYRVLSFGAAVEANARLVGTRMAIDAQNPSSSGLEIQLSQLGFSWNVRLTGTVGRPQAYAVAAAMAVVHALDGDEPHAIQRLEQNFHGMPGRMRLIEGIKHSWLIDDSYNSSPLAAFSALQDLASFPLAEGARRIAAMGDMLELGPLAESSHQDVGRLVAEKGIDMLVTCGTLAHIMADAAKAAGMPEERIFTFSESREAGRFIQSRLMPQDVVLIKGSQGARMERIAKELMADPLKAEELLVRHSPDWLAR